jgi:hypothetical protein
MKLRKSADLKVDDKATMYYTITPNDHNLAKIITKFSDYIQSTSKTPVRPLKAPSKSPLKNESYDLNLAKLELVVTQATVLDLLLLLAQPRHHLVSIFAC